MLVIGKADRTSDRWYHRLLVGALHMVYRAVNAIHEVQPFEIGHAVK